jgi:hypothetical protein
VGTAERHASVDVLGRGKPGFEHSDGGDEIGNQKRIHHQSAAVLGAHDLFAQDLGDECLCDRTGPLVDQPRTDHLYER